MVVTATFQKINNKCWWSTKSRSQSINDNKNCYYRSQHRAHKASTNQVEYYWLLDGECQVTKSQSKKLALVAAGRLAAGKETSRADHRLSALLPNKSAASDLPSLLPGSDPQSSTISRFLGSTICSQDSRRKRSHHWVYSSCPQHRSPCFGFPPLCTHSALLFAIYQTIMQGRLSYRWWKDYRLWKFLYQRSRFKA